MTDARAARGERDAAPFDAGPLASPGTLRRLAPFALLIGFVLAVMSNDPGLSIAIRVSMTLGSFLWLVGVLSTPWARFPRQVQAVPVLAAVVMCEAIVVADGGLKSEYLSLVLLPLLWLALYESRLSLALGLLVTASLVGVEFTRSPAWEVARHLIPIAIALVILPAVRQLVAANRTAIATLAEVASRDPLTGLLNRRALDDRPADQTDRETGGIGVMYLDIDKFKTVNDKFGHEAGDDLLRQVGHRISAAVRSTDTVARVGGDEFVVLCPGDAALTNGVRDRIDHLVNGDPYVLCEAPVVVTVSVGYTHSDDVPLDLTGLINGADHAMYSAKTAAS